MEERKIKKCSIIDDGDNVIVVEWELYRDDEYSHTYEQFYTKESVQQFIDDVGLETATPFLCLIK